MFLRPATPADAAAVAYVHVQAWRETYRGIMPDAVLEGPSVEERARAWRAVQDLKRAAGRVIAARS
jgi:hypothetical protein